KLPHCYVVDVFPSPQIFYPALVKLPAMPYLPALMDIIAGGYPFTAPRE
ncbi:LysR family transcriptional regulator, partial [Klebsiella pneumoniae]|nr:LysR family transcriptional regulator [Klebsiella pneumoniae]